MDTDFSFQLPSAREMAWPISLGSISAFAFRLQLPAIFRIFKTACRCAWSIIE
jgi:hypothetical protein